MLAILLKGKVDMRTTLFVKKKWLSRYDDWALFFFHSTTFKRTVFNHQISTKKKSETQRQMSANQRAKVPLGRTLPSCVSISNLEAAPLLYSGNTGSPTTVGEGPFVVPRADSSCASSPRGGCRQGGCSATSPRGSSQTPTGGGDAEQRNTKIAQEAAVIHSRPVAVAVESWETRKQFSEGSVPPHAMFAADVNQDGNTELVIGFSEGQLAVLRPGRRECLSLNEFAATISVLVHCPASNRIVVITLEGQCEVRRMKVSPTSSSKPSSSSKNQSDYLERRFSIPPNCTTASALSLEGVPERLFLGTDRGVFVYDLERGGEPLVSGVCFTGSTILGVKVVGVPLEANTTTTTTSVAQSSVATTTNTSTTKSKPDRSLVTVLTVAAMDGVRMWEAGDDTLQLWASSTHHTQRVVTSHPLLELKCCERCCCSDYIRGESAGGSSPTRRSGAAGGMQRTSSCGCDKKRIVAIDATPVCGLLSFFNGGSGIILVTLSQFGYVTLLDVSLQYASSPASGGSTSPPPPPAMTSPTAALTTELSTTSPIEAVPPSPYQVRVKERHQCDLRKPMIERIFLQQAVSLPSSNHAPSPSSQRGSSFTSSGKVVDSLDSIRAVALSTDGVCLILSTSSTTAVTQLRSDACSFSVAPTFSIPSEPMLQSAAASRSSFEGSGPILSIQYASIDLLIDYVVAPPYVAPQSLPQQQLLPVITSTADVDGLRPCEVDDDSKRRKLSKEEEEEEADRQYLEDRWSLKERALLVHVGEKLYPEVVAQYEDAKHNRPSVVAVPELTMMCDEGTAMRAHGDGDIGLVEVSKLRYVTQRRLCDLVEALCSSASPLAMHWMALHRQATDVEVRSHAVSPSQAQGGLDT